MVSISGTTASVTALVQRFRAWMTAPFTTPYDPSTYFMVVGIILISAYLWTRVLRHTFGSAD